MFSSFPFLKDLIWYDTFLGMAKEIIDPEPDENLDPAGHKRWKQRKVVRDGQGQPAVKALGSAHKYSLPDAQDTQMRYRNRTRSKTS